VDVIYGGCDASTPVSARALSGNTRLTTRNQDNRSPAERPGPGLPRRNVVRLQIPAVSAPRFDGIRADPGMAGTRRRLVHRVGAAVRRPTRPGAPGRHGSRAAGGGEHPRGRPGPSDHGSNAMPMDEPGSPAGPRVNVVSSQGERRRRCRSNASNGAAPDGHHARPQRRFGERAAAPAGWRPDGALRRPPPARPSTAGCAMLTRPGTPARTMHAVRRPRQERPPSPRARAVTSACRRRRCGARWTR
jgi:hypothetical protein